MANRDDRQSAGHIGASDMRLLPRARTFGPASALLALTALLIAASAHAQSRPNVLVLISDDQRPDTIAALGNPHIDTPNLDRLAREGFSFSRAYCMGSMSGAVCLPSRAMLNSGRTLWRVPMDLKDTPTWGQTMRQAGYATFGTGKWHNGRESFTRSFEYGASVFFGGMSDQFDVAAHDPDGKGGFTRTPDTKGRHTSELFADAAVRFVQDRRDDPRPLFVYVSFTAPHDPRTPPRRYLDKYDQANLPVPANFMPEHPFDNGEMKVRDEQLAPWPRTESIVREHIAAYYGMISHMDEQIGRILEAWNAAGRGENAIIVFTSDHGLAIGSHGLLGKQNLYEHSTGAPLIVHGRGVPHGGSSKAFAYLLDIFPTVCEMAGVEPPAGVEGRSLYPIVAGRQTSVRDTIFTAYKDVQRAVRDERWKLLVYPKVGRSQLFDLQSDPYELHDLSADAAHAEHRDRLHERLHDWQRELGDDLPPVEGR